MSRWGEWWCFPLSQVCCPSMSMRWLVRGGWVEWRTRRSCGVLERAGCCLSVRGSSLWAVPRITVLGLFACWEVKKKLSSRCSAQDRVQVWWKASRLSWLWLASWGAVLQARHQRESDWQAIGRRQPHPQRSVQTWRGDAASAGFRLFHYIHSSARTARFESTFHPWGDLLTLRRCNLKLDSTTLLRHLNQTGGCPRKAGAQVEGGGGGRRGRLSLIYEIFSLLLDLDTRSWNRLHSTFIPWQRRRGTRQWHCL